MKLKNGILFTFIVLVVSVISGSITNCKKEKKVNKYKLLAEKHLQIMQSMNQWLLLKQEGRTIEDYFRKLGYKRIAIYGMSYLGERLYHELKNLGIDVAYAIDKNADMIYGDIDVFEPDVELYHVDAVVVTAITFFDEIKEELSAKVNCPIVSLNDILFMDEKA